MAKQLTSTSVPREGGVSDLNQMNTDTKQFLFCLNGSMESNSQEGNIKTVQNEASNILAVNFPEGFVVVGRRYIPEQNRTIYMLVNPTTGLSQIGEVKDCIYNDDSDDATVVTGCEDCGFPVKRIDTPLEKTQQTPYCQYFPLIMAECLNFNINYPIRIQYKITDCSLNIYFTDKLNQRRFVYFDIVDGELVLQNRFKTIIGYDSQNCNLPIYSDALDCNKISYHPDYRKPCIDLLEVGTGGSLKAGTYQALVSYTDVSGNALSDYTAGTNIIPVFTKQITFETNYITDKSILLKINNLDTDVFAYYTIIIAETIDNFTEFKKLGTFPTTVSEVRYTGGETLIKLDAKDVFFKRAFYELAGNVTSANDYLFFSDLEEYNTPNLQRVANKVRFFWETVAIPEAAYRDPQNSFRFRSFDRDEVYAAGLMFEMTNGQEYGPYHVPGPSKEYLLNNYSINVDELINNDDTVCYDDCGNRVPCCTDAVGAQSAFVSVGCNDSGCTSQGEMILTFFFPVPTTSVINLKIGQINQNSIGGQKVASGYSLFALPSGVNAWTYFGDPAEPFIVTVPAGVTSYTVTHIGFSPASIFNAGMIWPCHSCLFPTTDLYIKDEAANPQFSYSNTQGVAVHNITQVNPPNTNCGRKRWETYNTGFVIGQPHEVIGNCHDNKVWEWGEFGYWQSIRRYPNIPLIWGDLCGESIRHHKYPDSRVTHIHDGLNGTKGFSDNNIVFPIGFRLDMDSVKAAIQAAITDGVLSQEDANRIKSVRVIRGNRVGNESIVAKGLLFDMWNYSKYGNTYYYPNYPYNDLRDDPFIAPTSATYNGSNTSDPTRSTFSPTKRYTFHSPDIHFKNPEIGTELKLETLEYGKSEGFFNLCEEQAKYRFLSTAAMTLALAAGVAAAFSSEKEKQCKAITAKADVTTIPLFSGTAPGAFVTIPLPTFPPAGGQYGFLPSIDPVNSLGWNETTGLPTDFISPWVSEVTHNTCKGRPFQLLGPASLNPAAIFAQQLIYMGIIAMREMNIIIDLIHSLLPLKNFATQYNSVGKYVNYKNIDNAGNKKRGIERSAYLEPMVQLVNESVSAATSTFSNIYINNWNRERSVYLKSDVLKSAFPSPSVTDTSRFTLDDAGLGLGDLNRRIYRDVSSYYGSIKNYVPDQYGEISDIDYVETGHCGFPIDDVYTIHETGVFGGDKFITRFALKRKMPFFLQTRFRQINESDVKYSELGNVGFPNYYINTEEPILERVSNLSFDINDIFSGTLLQNLLGVARTRLDARSPKFFYQSGFVPLYSYGIPYFLVESDVNTDYRHGQNNLEKDFYPHNQHLEEWLQENKVSITEDNYYFYNTTYSKQDKEGFIGVESPDLDLRICKAVHPSRVISSPQSFNDNKVDNWLIFKPNDYFDFPLANGRVIGLDGIESDKVLVRFENTSKIFNAYDVLNTADKEIQVGNSGLFATRPKEFASTTLGYAGTQNTDLLRTEFGHIWPDAKRGQIFNLGANAASLKDLAQDIYVRSWLKENLPFQIKKDFPKIDLRDLDNNFKGIGISLSFDKRFGRLFITKLDYKRLNKNITYDATTKNFYIDDTVISVYDKKYFCNKSWTASYNFLTKDWIYHSFTPNFYTDNVDLTQAGWNFDRKGQAEAKLWSHNVTNKSYQVYCGKLYPFIVEVVSEPTIVNNISNCIEFDTEALRYHNQYDTSYNREITFNKAWVYNERQFSGELDLIVRNESDLFASSKYPKVEGNRQKILLTNNNNRWYFNQFWDIVNTQKGDIPFILNKCNNVEKVPNIDVLNYYKPDLRRQEIRGKQTRVRLIFDNESRYKLLFHYLRTEKGRAE